MARQGITLLVYGGKNVSNKKYLVSYGNELASSPDGGPTSGHIQAIKFSIISPAYLITMSCWLSVDPELREIQSDELIVYDVELSEY